MMRPGDTVEFGRYRIELDEHDDADSVKQCWLVWVLDEHTREPIGGPRQADICPYLSSEHTAKLWILAGLPNRMVLGKTCPLDAIDLGKIILEKRRQAANAVLMRWNGCKVDELVAKIRDACDPLSVRYVERAALEDDAVRP